MSFESPLHIQVTVTSHSRVMLCSTDKVRLMPALEVIAVYSPSHLTSLSY